MKKPIGRLSMVRRFSLVAIALCSGVGCEDRYDLPESNVITSKSALHESQQPLVDQSLAPVRQLTDPDKVYMKSIEETYLETGTLRHTVHVYNTVSGADVNFDIAALTEGGAVDGSHTFTSVVATPIIDGTAGSPQSFADGTGQAVYTVSAAQKGWYRFHFHYEAVNPGRTLTISAYDENGDPLKMGWDDPEGANIQIRATFVVEDTINVFFKGGVFRNALPIMHAYVDDVTVNGNLLYRRAFDQGLFNFPLGVMPAGEHTLEFSISKSAKLGRNWFGINETSFDLFNTKTEWDNLQFIYDGEMRTGDYDAWNQGVAFAQGETLELGVRPPPVRKGTTFIIALNGFSLAGPWWNASIHVYPLGSSTETNWITERPADQDYAGGIYTDSGFEARNREHWRVTVPEDAPVGRYVIRAISPFGTQVGEDVLFYVIHNPFSLLFDLGIATQKQIDVYGYDENWDGMPMTGETEFDLDSDPGRDHFLGKYRTYGTAGEYTMNTYITGAFRRLGDDQTRFSLLDYAVASADGTTSVFESMRRLFRLVSQRFTYNGGGGHGGDATLGIIGSPDMFPPEEAYLVSSQGVEMSNRSSAICYDTAAVMASVPRSLGILTRMVSSENYLIGWGDHAFTEAFIPTLPHHTGKTGPTPSTPLSDTDHWYAYDATNVQHTVPDTLWNTTCELISPRSQVGKSTWVIWGDPLYDYNVVTDSLTWDFALPDGVPTTNILNVTDAYEAGSEFWLTQSGATGWLGIREKDVYQIDKAATGATAVRVRSLTEGGNLEPKICVGSASTVPVMPLKCTDADTRYELPDGDSYVVVFNDAGNALPLWGDTIQYELTLEYENLCNDATAIDMGAPGTSSTIVDNGCLKVTQYPTWWGTRQMQLQNTEPGNYPIPFQWSNCDTTQGSDTITGDWQSFFIDNISDACPTYVKLNGSGSGNLTFFYYSM